MPLPREPRDLSVKGTVATGIGLALFVFAVLAALHAYVVRARPAPRDTAPLPATSPVGEAEFESGGQLAAFRAREAKELAEWRRIDERFVQIPIDRALELEGGTR